MTATRSFPDKKVTPLKSREWWFDLVGVGPEPGHKVVPLCGFPFGGFAFMVDEPLQGCGWMASRWFSTVGNSRCHCSSRVSSTLRTA
jgi:hypothetical protein